MSDSGREPTNTAIAIERQLSGRGSAACVWAVGRSGWISILARGRTGNVSHDLVELDFSLEPDEDDWPPYAVEGLWCHREGAAFRILNCPLFVKGLAVDDLIMADVESDPSTPALLEVLSFELLQPSDHSTVWLMAPEEELRQSLRSRLDEIGCRTEGGPARMAGLVAIDVPGTVTLRALDEILDPYRSAQQIEVAFPTLRHTGTED